jgi:neutral ceramidase
MKTYRHTSLILLLLAWALVPAQAAGGLKAGVGKAVITPAQDMWLAGYAARTAPSDGKIHDLYAKALAFEDETGARSVILTTDLLGLPRSFVSGLAREAQSRFELPRERLIVAFSHTHSGPVIGGDRLFEMYGLDEEQSRRAKEYTASLPVLLLKAMEDALSDLEPCRIEWGKGRAGFATNRRVYTVHGMSGGANPIGPVDHDVPVLKISRGDGSIKAVLHGYACHNTTLSGQQFCGDYSGFSQQYIEDRLPGAAALFVAGCGGDANPLPRGKVEQARQYGEELGAAVLGVVRQKLLEVRGPIVARFEEIPLAFSDPPPRSEIEKKLDHPNVYEQRRARRLLQTMDEEGELPAKYPYAVQFWRIGDSLQMPVLAGEVVVDYALQLKHDLGREHTWVIAYANDFVAYIPSIRVLREGGYEGGDSMVYFGHHGPWKASIEADILSTVRRFSEETRR